MNHSTHALKDVEMRLPPLRRSLSARLLVLTVIFIMAASTILFLPLIARYRLEVIGNQLAAAELAVLGMENADRPEAASARTAQLLAKLKAHSVVLQRDDASPKALSEPNPPQPDASYDLETRSNFGLIADAVTAIAQPKSRVVRLRGRPPQDRSAVIDMVMNDAPILKMLRRYAVELLGFSVLISLIASALVFLTLRTLILVPLRHLTASMILFRNQPEDPGRVISVSGRKDEIGLAEWELAAMQSALRRTLGQRGRLAALGEAVSKINHDLRSILSTARLVSDRLAESTDPIVKKSLPPLLSSLDRAVRLCKRTLDFAAAEPALRRTRFELRRFVEDAVATAALVETKGFTFINDIPADIQVFADRDQLFRAFVNLVRNAVQAEARRLSMKARLTGGEGLAVTIVDDGVGIPAPAQATLFRPFAAGRGTGLGLAIAREVMRSHGGSIELVSTGPMGTTFELTFPASALAVSAEVRAQRRWGAFRAVDGRKQG